MSEKNESEEKEKKSEEKKRPVPTGMKRIRLVRSIVLGGSHAEEGEVHDVARPLAHRLIGEGSAVHHLEEGDESEAGPTTVNRMENPTNADPPSRKVAPAPPRVKK